MPNGPAPSAWSRSCPALRDAAVEADRLAEFPMQHVKTLSEAGLLGLVVPERFGGLGGGLRDLAAATFAMGTACPSTALAYFFQCSSTSRGLLPLEAIEAGLFTDDEVPVVRAFAEKVLHRLGQRGSVDGQLRVGVGQVELGRASPSPPMPSLPTGTASTGGC